MNSLLKILSISILLCGVAQAKSNASLIGKSYIQVSIGSHSHDDFRFEKSNEQWKLSLVDRESTGRKKTKKRLVPADLVLPLLSQMDRFVRINHEKLVYNPFIGCTAFLKLEWGASVLSKSKKNYCIDRLSRASDRELAEWMRSFKKLFRF